jgi:hypothetical protein
MRVRKLSLSIGNFPQDLYDVLWEGAKVKGVTFREYLIACLRLSQIGTPKIVETKDEVRVSPITETVFETLGEVMGIPHNPKTCRVYACAVCRDLGIEAPQRGLGAVPVKSSEQKISGGFV